MSDTATTGRVAGTRSAGTAPPAAEFHALHEIVARARTRLSDGVWGYLVGGAETETSDSSSMAACAS